MFNSHMTVKTKILNYRYCDLVFSEILPQLQTQDDVETLKSHDIAYM